MKVAEAIRDRLTRAFSPTRLTIVDDSHRHAGHAGARDGGESHFNVEIVAASFAGRTRMERHRMIHAVLAEELRGPVHALALSARTPAEAGSA